ncbi:ATP-binding protein [Deinococcus sp. NW-56]|uniref:GAF domain-containing sensor histidine kinase n=1 Tax=Deinococcus sp. NW-56 TaxID=2080419 RepID=UPI000CF51A76|nr:ATP-binding protein [Deinococcus sp. NW-56]
MVCPPAPVHTDLLLVVAEALAAARRPQEVVEVLLAHAHAALRVPVAAWLVPGGEQEIAPAPTAQEGDGVAWPDLATLRAVWQRREPVLLEGSGAALLPLQVGEEPVRGLLGLAWPQAPDAAGIRLARALAGQAALHLGRLSREGRADPEGTDPVGGLARAALRIGQAPGLQAALEVITEEARLLVGAHQSVVSLTVSEDWAQAITAVSLSDKYAAWQDYAVPPDGSGIYALVCRVNGPLRLTQAELEAHPAWRGFGQHADQHPPMRGWLAVPLVGKGGRNIGLIQLSDREEGEFSARDEQILVQLAQFAAVTVENARLIELAQAELERREQAEARLRVLNMELEGRIGAATHELQSRAAALDAFVAFSEAVGTQTDVAALARQAVRVMRTTLGHVSVGYYEPEGGLWRAQVWSDDMTPEVVAQIRAGIPAEAPNLARAVASGEAAFVDGWDAEANALSTTVNYGAGAFVPVVIGGEVRCLLAVGTRAARRWTEHERSVMRAVGRSFQLALERAEATALLERRNGELAARTRALEGFAHLTGDLAAQGDPRLFVRRAQEVILSLLPPGYALYYERGGDHWRNRVQVGEVGNAALQAFIDAGPRVGATPSVDVPWQTRRPFYQDAYARGSDTPEEMVQHVSTVASLPVLRHGEVVGVLIAVIFEGRPWSHTDRIILETVVSSLGLALERAESVALLAERTAELEQTNAELARSNAELEQFAYVASHDLQAPIRAMTSFAGLTQRRYGDVLDDRGRMYLTQIAESGEHMKRLVDDLLTFSRVHTTQREPERVDSGAVFDAVRRRLETGADLAGARLTRGPLPPVLADPQQLDQLLQNLISNGLKYRRGGVTPEVHVWAEREGDFWRFGVRDNGIGIEPQYFGRIFEIFQRLHGREQYEGTGIGLAVCKKIVERHGGRLWVESEVGRGTTFFFTLPAVPGDAGPPFAG